MKHFVKSLPSTVLLAVLAGLGFHMAAMGQDNTLNEATQAISGSLANQLEQQATSPDPTDKDEQKNCVFFHKRGMANQRLGRYPQALSDLQRALALNVDSWLSPDQWCDRWRIQMDLSSTYAQAGDNFGWIEHIKSISQEQRGRNSIRYLVTLLQFVDAHANLNLQKEAENYFQQATAALPEARTQRGWANSQHNILNLYTMRAAYLQELRGNYVEAERLRRTSLREAELYIPDASRGAGADSQHVRLAKQNHLHANRLLASNLTYQAKFGEAEYLSNNQLRDTLTYFSFNSPAVSGSLAILGNAKLQQGRVADAKKYLDLANKSIEGTQVARHSTFLATRRAQLGLVLCMQERWSEAINLFEQRAADLRSNPQQLKTYGPLHIDWAYALIESGQANQAVDMLKRIETSQAARLFIDPVTLAFTRGYLGYALTINGRHEDAMAAFKASVPAIVSALHKGADEDAGYIRQYRSRVVLEGYLDLLSQLSAEAARQAGIDPVAEAFRIADVARGSQVQMALVSSAARANIPDPELAKLARQEQDTGNQIKSLEKILVRLASAAEAQRLQKVMADMQRDIQSLAKEQARLKQEIAKRFPEYASLTSPEPIAPATLQRALTPQEAVVAIYMSAKKTFVWTITPQQTGFRTVPVGHRQIAAQVERLRAGLDISDGQLKRYDTRLAYELYQTLLAPDATMWESSKVLNVIAHAELGQLPFSTLLTNSVDSQPGTDPQQYAKLPWLIDKVAIALQPSASGLYVQRKFRKASSQQQPFVGFGDPLFALDQSGSGQSRKMRNLQVAAAKDDTMEVVQQAQSHADAAPAPAPENAPPPNTGKPTLSKVFSLLPPLPDTADELREIAQSTGASPQRDVYLGTQATESNIKSMDLSKYRVLAFATHGLIPGEVSGLDQPALALSNPELSKDKDNDGLLTLEEVLGLKLNADWVVLSACNTASADGSANEAVSGLGRGFFFAGARSLLVSNWAVETVSARLLTTTLFAQQKQNPNLSRAEALRQSMLSLMQDRASEYGHPVFWAPFSLVGDGVSR